MPAPRGVPAPGGACSRGGCLLLGGSAGGACSGGGAVETPLPPKKQTATVVDSTHPTGMHFCYTAINCSTKFNCNTIFFQNNKRIWSEDLDVCDLNLKAFLTWTSFTAVCRSILFYIIHRFCCDQEKLKVAA